jgi:hypothetical protein
MAAIRGNFAPELDPSVRTIFFDRYNELEQVMPKVFNINTSDRDQETESATTGFGMLQATSELGALDYEDPLKMYNTVYRHLKYTKGFKVSDELYEDDQHNIISRMPKALAKAVVKTTEYYGAQTFNNAFSTSYTSYGDGKPLISTSHTRADGGTSQSNGSAVGLTFGEINLETGRLALEKALDDKGQMVTFDANRILVPVDLEKTARIVTDSQLRSGSGNNDVNVYKGKYDVLSWRYITSTTAWFLMDKMEHLLEWYWRIRPEFKSDYDFNAGAALFKVRIRFSVGWSDWRGVWGSKGDGAAYSS